MKLFGVELPSDPDVVFLCIMLVVGLVASLVETLLSQRRKLRQLDAALWLFWQVGERKEMQDRLDALLESRASGIQEAEAYLNTLYLEGVKGAPHLALFNSSNVRKTHRDEECGRKDNIRFAENAFFSLYDHAVAARKELPGLKLKDRFWKLYLKQPENPAEPEKTGTAD